MKNKKETLYGCSLEDIKNIMNDSVVIRQNILGHIAEHKLEEKLKKDKNIKYLGRPHHTKNIADFIISYQKQRIKIEHKLFSVRGGILKKQKTNRLDIEYQYTGIVALNYSRSKIKILPNGIKVKGRNRLITSLDIVAAGLYVPELNEWKFIFCSCFDLPTLNPTASEREKHKAGKNNIDSSIPVEYSHLFFKTECLASYPPEGPWSEDFGVILNKHLENLKNNSKVKIIEKGYVNLFDSVKKKVAKTTQKGVAKGRKASIMPV